VHEAGKVAGVVCEDAKPAAASPSARCVVNATGPWVDLFRQQDAEAGQAGQAHGGAQPGRARGGGPRFPAHGPRAAGAQDGRRPRAVCRALAGQGHSGNHRHAAHDLAREPLPFPEELDFILRRSRQLPEPPPTLADIRSIWVGLRPLVKPQDDDGENTKKISREHTVLASKTGLVTVTGGKWTTYRAMAEDVLAECFSRRLPSRLPA
jgi:glycerol-3-phosphate dehydrogenase